MSRARAHAVLMGAGTLRAFKNPVTIKRKRFYLKRELLGLRRHPLNIVVGTNLDFDLSLFFYKSIYRKNFCCSQTDF